MGSDANGELGNKDRNEPELNKIIGTIARTDGPGKGKLTQRICQEQMIPMNTWMRQPKNTTAGKHDIHMDQTRRWSNPTTNWLPYDQPTIT